MEQTRQATSRRAAVHEFALGRVLAALSAAGVPAAPLKGVTLARETFEDLTPAALEQVRRWRAEHRQAG